MNAKHTPGAIRAAKTIIANQSWIDAPGFLVFAAGTIDQKTHAPKMLQALKQCKRLIDEALPKFNWGASALDANAIQLLNETPGIVNTIIAKVESES
jgi:hypothetical protein